MVQKRPPNLARAIQSHSPKMEIIFTSRPRSLPNPNPPFFPFSPPALSRVSLNLDFYFLFGALEIALNYFFFSFYIRNYFLFLDWRYFNSESQASCSAQVELSFLFLLPNFLVTCVVAEESGSETCKVLKLFYRLFGIITF